MTIAQLALLTRNRQPHETQAGVRYKTCLVDGCEEKNYGRGWCVVHWTRWSRHGDPLGGGPSPSKKGSGLIEIDRAIKEASADACWQWPFGNDRQTYGRVTLDGKHRLAHRIVCELAHGSPPTPTHQAAHSCGNPGCINPHHLRWATAKGNADDRSDHGRTARGSRSAMSRLTEADVIAARAQYAAGGVSKAALARQFGVSAAAMKFIINGRNWAWLKEGKE
jgi:hypothetical protein